MDKVYILWDKQSGYDTSVLYKDERSAKFALKVKYTDYWIQNEYAKVDEIRVIGFE
jgi:hypothetical protein